MHARTERKTGFAEVALMPWGVHSEYNDDGGPDVDIDEEQEDVERGEEGTERTESFDVEDALSRLE